MPPEDILLILAPPVRLVEWLEKMFESKRQVGQDVPPEFTNWLERWKTIRSDMPSDIDYIALDEWQACSEVIGRFVTVEGRRAMMLPATPELKAAILGEKVTA